MACDYAFINCVSLYIIIVHNLLVYNVLFIPLLHFKRHLYQDLQYLGEQTRIVATTQICSGCK